MFIGIDIIEINRIKKLCVSNERFLNKIYTKKELEYCLSKKNRHQHLAARFATKEAMFKALGTGWTGKIRWTDVELLNDEKGKPYLNFYGNVKELVEEKNINAAEVSVSHCNDYAIAQVLLVAGAKSVAAL
ncbi:MAG: holo-ACP synthase [Candidatus Kuenenia sp.]|nr:holo-ACP synthase [Candidatus Kuenenia hertensis]